MESLPILLLIAWLAPLASFVLIVFFGPRMGKHGEYAGHVATGAIVLGFVLSIAAWVTWRNENRQPPKEHGPEHKTAADGADAHGAVQHAEKPYIAGDWYRLSPPGLSQKITVGYYIDALTIGMFVVVTLIASCIHFYSMGYMHEELHEVTDHEVILPDGHHLHRPGRYHRFFQYMSLFCFSMLGLVIAGNIAMVFVFWELVGICSYFLIGFYIERKSASNAANKAFIVNRVGDFGMIIGLMAIWGSLGTFAFGDVEALRIGRERPIEAALNRGELPEGLRQEFRNAGIMLPEPAAVRVIDAPGSEGHAERRWTIVQPENGREFYVIKRHGDHLVVHETGVFSLVRPVKSAGGHAAPHAAADSHAAAAHPHELTVPAGMLVSAEDAGVPREEQNNYAYWLLIVAGVGVFCGCVGKSAQFPLHTWLPDAMEGPTPVSALVHSATMVAAGVYLVGRFYPVFTPEVLLVIAIIGAITLFLAATIAITAVDIKRVLAYSTVSQLGYMMLALGLGGWIAGLFHLITHAFFKSLLFLCSGSVIHACHTNDMRKMGGLLEKMPYTGYTMLIGCLAIAGAGIPFVIGLSGYYSKDAILAQALNVGDANPALRFFFLIAAGGAAITAFYMFRLWFMTFLGKPRDHHVYEHVHEAPPVMYVPLLILAFFAVTVGWNWAFGVPSLLEQAVPDGTHAGAGQSNFWMALEYPKEHAPHHEAVTAHERSIHAQATLAAFGTALFGVFLAALMYWLRVLSPEDARAYFSPVYRLLWNKWWFDELYHALFVRPTLFFSKLVARIDRAVIDWLIDNTARGTVRISKVDDQIIDRTFVDGLVNLTGNWIFSLGVWLRRFQTGRLRQYVTFIVVGTVALFVLISFWSRA